MKSSYLPPPATAFLFMVLWLLSFSQTTFAQNNTSQTSSHINVYNNARVLGDWETAITALHYHLAEAPAQNELHDSLAACYFKVGKMGSCALKCEDILSSAPENTFIRELAAEAYFQVGYFEDALHHYTNLFRLNGSTFHHFQMADLQFQLREFALCGTSIEAMLADPQIDGQTIQIDWGNDAANVPLRAALLNLRGDLLMEMGQENDARKSWRDAVKIDKTFKLPRQSLNALRQKRLDDMETGGR